MGTANPDVGFKHPLQGVLLVETHVGVPVPVLHADNHVADDGNAGAVARKLLVGRFGVILLRLDN